MKISARILLALALGSACPAALNASTAIGPDGYTLYRNDDGFSEELSLPFSINLFGHEWSSFYLNNNGNISFGGGIGQYTPAAFPVTLHPMIAPYWGDVDTRCGSCGTVKATATPDTLSVTWDNVGYFNQHSDKLNTFSLSLTKVGNNGDFDINFNYSRLQWTTGDASGGSNGVGGTPAQAGFDAGDRVHFFTLPGSQTSSILDLVNGSNDGTPGSWTFAIRSAVLGTGETPDDPLFPNGTTTDGGYVFANVPVSEGLPLYVDPLVATGYDYSVTGGPLITSAIFSALTGDADGYDIYTLGDLSTAGWLGHVAAGGTFDFLNPVSGFSLRGIDLASALNPNDPTAFVTGLIFDRSGTATITQTPVTTDTSAAPEPAAWMMMILGFGMVGSAMRCRSMGGRVRFA